MLQKIKDWLLLILLAIVGLLTAMLLSRKPQWIKEKEKEVEKRQETIEKEKKQAERAKKYYDEMKQKHNEKIKKAGDKIEAEEFNNPDDSADSITDFLNSDRN